MELESARTAVTLGCAAIHVHWVPRIIAQHIFVSFAVYSIIFMRVQKRWPLKLGRRSGNRLLHTELRNKTKKNDDWAL
jgi:hypothetical protein